MLSEKLKRQIVKNKFYFFNINFALRFNNKLLGIDSACAPGNILWANLNVPFSTLVLRRFISLLLTIFLLFLS